MHMTRDQMRRETLAKAISSPVGREILKTVLRKHLRPEVSGPLCDTVDGRLKPDMNDVVEAIQDAVLDSLNAGRIDMAVVRELLGHLNGRESNGADETAAAKA